MHRFRSIIAGALGSVALAQIPAGVNVTAVPACAVGCLENNTDAAIGCAVSDFKCLCSSTPYINAISCCTTKSCGAADQEATLEFELQVCNMYNISIPNFLGCSPLSSSVTYVAPLPTASGDPIAATISTVVTVGPAFATIPGGAAVDIGSASILTGTCSSPYIATMSLTSNSVLNFPWVGCSPENPACCPWHMNAQGPLVNCPADYTTVSGGCCPTGWSVYSSTLAGQTPCVSAATVALVAPSTTATNVKAITNQMFTLRYTLATPTTSLSQSATIGIGVGVGVGGFLLIILVAFLLRRKFQTKEGGRVQTYRSQYEMGEESPSKSMHIGAPPYQQTQVYTAVGELPSPDTISPSRSQRSTTNWSTHLQQNKPLPVMELPGSTFIHEHHPALKPYADEFDSDRSGYGLEGYRPPFQSVERLSTHDREQ